MHRPSILFNREHSKLPTGKMIRLTSNSKVENNLFISQFFSSKRIFCHFLSTWLFLISISLFATSTFAREDCVPIDKKTAINNLANAVSYYKDQSNNLSLQDIIATDSHSWTQLDQAVPNFGFSSASYWFKFDMCNSFPGNTNTVLEIKYPLLDSISLYALAGSTIVFEEHTGDSIRFSERPVQHRNFVFYLPNIPDKTLNLYLRIDTTSAVQVPLGLYTEAIFFKHNQVSLLIQGAYFGIILAMILYNGFLFCTLRELPYLYYVLFTASYFGFQGVFQGLFQQFIFDSVYWQNHSLLTFGYISIFFIIVFSDTFLNLPQHYKFISRLLRVVAALALLFSILASILPYAPMIKIMLAMAIPVSTIIMFVGIKLWLTGHRPARIFTIAWSTLLFAFILSSLSKLGYVPLFFWTENIMQIGGLLEVILLSIALAERINEEKRQRILIEQNVATSLEKQVQERTDELIKTLKELETTNTTLETEQTNLEIALQEINTNHEELKSTYDELKSTQSKLFQAEKMQSVGLLAAGIAHEINTPIQYIASNLDFLKESFSDGDTLVNEYNRLVKNGNCIDEVSLKEIKTIEQDVDWDFLKDEIPLAIEQSQTGIQQISSIVLAMKEFSHPGSSEKEIADINQLIRTTSTVSRNEWKNITELKLDFEDNVVLQVPCTSNQISQVILNLLINAAHAITEQQQATGSSELGIITISTKKLDHFARITITDTGGGVPEAIRHKIFDPFFTTKEVGKGTGQGLAITHDIIVNKHGGRLEVEVEDKIGTTFTIMLPLELHNEL